MRYVSRLISTVSVAGLLLGLVAVPPVNAQVEGLSDEQIALVQENCQTVKTTLNQLHASDALLRVNRGQVYESILTRLIQRFNTRLSNNDFDNRAMVTITDKYQQSLNSFRLDYQVYEEQLSATIKMDCQAKPEEFHFAIEDARAKRAQVHEDVQALYRTMEDYDSVVDDFLLSYQMENGK